MESNCKFQGYIAFPVERYGRKYVGESFPTASTIANGEFMDAMLQILAITYGGLKQVSNYVEQCPEYDGLSCLKASPEIVRSDCKILEDCVCE